MLQTVTNRDTERANHAKGAISEIAESASYVFSIPPESSTARLHQINCFTIIGLALKYKLRVI